MSAALIAIDMLNPYDHEDAEPLKDSVREKLGSIRRLIEHAPDEGYG